MLVTSLAPLLALLTPLVTEAILLDAPHRNLVQELQHQGCHKLVELVRSAGLAQALHGKGPLTVLAPTDAAFAAVPAAVMAELGKNATLLKEVLEFHVISGKVMSSDLSNDKLVDSLAPSLKIRFNIYGNKVVTATGAPVVRTDQEASNGVVHLLSAVMYPLPAQPLPQTLALNPNFSTLAYLAFQAQLIPALQGQALTLFAPSNDAFKKLPANVVNDLLLNITRLKEVLTYHVVQGTDYSAGLTSQPSVKSLEGETLTIKVTQGKVEINDAMVVAADVSASNGVYHEIDTVLFPTGHGQA